MKFVSDALEYFWKIDGGRFWKNLGDRRTNRVLPKVGENIMNYLMRRGFTRTFCKKFLSKLVPHCHRIRPSALALVTIMSSRAQWSLLGLNSTSSSTSNLLRKVIGNMKTICVLALGWVLFGSVFSIKNLMGMIIVVLGMIFYKCAEQADKRKQVMVGEDVKLLKDRVSKVIQSDIKLGLKNS